MNLPGSTLGVFVVDDHPSFVAAARLVIAATPGFEMIGGSTSAIDALAWLGKGSGTQTQEQRQPDLLMVDVVMPEMSGTELASAYRAAGGKARVVFMSSYGPNDLPAEVVRPVAGRSAFLAKSDLDPAALLEIWSQLSEPCDRPT